MNMRIALMYSVLASCTQDVDPAWQLDHDRVIAVRMSPNRIAVGEVATVDVLLGRAGAPPIEVDPATAEVISPTRLVAALQRSGSRWTIATPSNAELAAVRDELGLAQEAPVPLRVRVTVGPQGLVAYKNVWLGEHADNPVIGPVAIDGVDRSAATSITVARDVDIRLAVDVDDSFNVNWLTSCGSMFDFDLPRAYLRVEADDPSSGTLGVVVRDGDGGVAWQLWSIAAD